jgi:hypothetical protein
MEIAKTLADVLNRDITQHECQSFDGEMKLKGIGYNDYLN